MFEKAEQPQTTPASSGPANAFLGKGTKIKGSIAFDGPAEIAGEIDGEVTSKDSLTVGKSASLNAAIKGATVIVHGRVTGNVTATQRLELHASGRIDGDITCATLVIHEGGQVNGQCSMGATAKDDKRPTIETQPISVKPPAADQTSKTG
jgi:cytoskeletal protein CcmA (bactofilin family)